MPRRIIILTLLFFVSLLGAACSSPSRSVREAGADGTSPRAGGAGAVASAEKAATEAGLTILRSSGGAVDAAVTVALALAVVQPQAGNLGGGGFAVVRWEGEVYTLDFREVAPAAARPDMFLAADGSPRPQASRIGPLAAGVPGSPVGLYELHRRFGSLPWSAVVQPAIDLAREGFVVTPRLHESLEFARSRLARFESSARVWLPQGEPPPPGTLMRLPTLASTLESYAEQGPAGVMSGPVAAAVEAASRADGGILTAADLGAYRAIWRDPIRFRAFGWEIASMPLPSSGGIILGQTMLMMERLEWGALAAGDPLRLHLLAEVWRRAYADRYLLGDPASSLADADSLLADAWIARRAAEIEPQRATPSREVGHWPGGETEISADTTHLSVADGAGNVVALTTTLNGWFGCALLVEGAGFFLNNEMDDFAAAIDQPNLFGLVQGEANEVRPGARMLSSMTPTVAWRGDEVIALGSPGGGKIPTATAQVLLHLIVDDLTLREAVGYPRTHHQWQPDELRVEPDALSDDLRSELERRGHRLREVRSIGEVHVVRSNGDGTSEAFADARGPGAAGVADRQSE